jgi:branched-chain amino acid transport system permease protein
VAQQTVDTNKLNEELKSGYSAIARFGQQRVRNLGILVAVIVVVSIYAVIDGGGHLFLERSRDALNNGFIYAAMALALALIYKATGVVNFAQGNMAMFGTFIAWVLVVEQGFPVWLGIIGAMVLSALGAAVIERLFVRPFDPGNHLAITIVTLAWFLILGAVATVIWGADPKAFPTPFPGTKEDYVTVLGVRVFLTNVGVWLTVLAVLAIVTVLLRKTKVGLAFRAVSSSLESSRLVGIHIGRTLQFGWAIAAAVGTLAGCLIARDTLLSPNFMGTVLIYSFAAVTLGGLDSLGGAVLGGVLIAFVETMVGGYIPLIGPELALATALGVIVVVLLAKPSGLFGTSKVERV